MHLNMSYVASVERTFFSKARVLGSQSYEGRPVFNACAFFEVVFLFCF